MFIIGYLSISYASDLSVQITPLSMDFFGVIKGAQKGDIVTVVDPDQVVCGKFVIKTPGQYGFLHVYGDDPATPVDEGAEISDQLTFLLNGKTIMTDGIVWAGDKQRKRLDVHQ